MVLISSISSDCKFIKGEASVLYSLVLSTIFSFQQVHNKCLLKIQRNKSLQNNSDTSHKESPRSLHVIMFQNIANLKKWNTNISLQLATQLNHRRRVLNNHFLHIYKLWLTEKYMLQREMCLKHPCGVWSFPDHGPLALKLLCHPSVSPLTLPL